MSETIKLGQKAPNFSLERDGASLVKLSDYTGKKLVIFFYPKDNTPGCTKEAIAFSQAKQSFADLNTEILGISADTVKRHDNFIAKHNLTIPLAADPELETLKKYGVWVKKSMYGREYMGIVRTTVLIESDGTIMQIWSKVRVKDHVGAVLQAVKEL